VKCWVCTPRRCARPIWRPVRQCTALHRDAPAPPRTSSIKLYQGRCACACPSVHHLLCMHVVRVSPNSKLCNVMWCQDARAAREHGHARRGECGPGPGPGPGPGLYGGWGDSGALHLQLTAGKSAAATAGLLDASPKIYALCPASLHAAAGGISSMVFSLVWSVRAPCARRAQAFAAAHQTNVVVWGRLASGCSTGAERRSGSLALAFLKASACSWLRLDE